MDRVPEAPVSDRLARFSRAMALVTSIGIALVLVAMVLAFVIPEWTRNLALARVGQPGEPLSFTLSNRLAGAAVVVLPVGVLLFGLWEIRALFHMFANGQVFTETAARHLQRFAAAILAQSLLGPLSSTGLLLAFTFNNPPGRRLLGFALSIDDYIALIVGGLLLAIAWVMREAARLAEENARFV
jgi:hypothetical protein